MNIIEPAIILHTEYMLAVGFADDVRDDIRPAFETR